MMSRKFSSLPGVDKGKEQQPDAANARYTNQGEQLWHVRPYWADRLPGRSPQATGYATGAIVLVLALWGAVLFAAGVAFGKFVL